jgi:type IV pilus assembly protein PilB
VLIKAGRISPAQLEAALALQRRTRTPIGQALITLGAVNEMTMRDALCTQLHINFFDVDPIGIDRRLAGLISERYAARHLIVPLFRVGDILVVAMDDPSDTERIERLEFNLGLQIEVIMTTMEKLNAAMRRLYGARVPADIDVFARRNILIGPLRDHFVAALAERGLRGVSVASFG